MGAWTFPDTNNKGASFTVKQHGRRINNRLMRHAESRSTSAEPSCESLFQAEASVPSIETEVIDEDLLTESKRV